MIKVNDTVQVNEPGHAHHGYRGVVVSIKWGFIQIQPPVGRPFPVAVGVQLDRR